MLGEKLTFPEPSAIKPRTVVMNVGGGIYTARPLDGGQSNGGNKRRKTPRTDPFHFNMQDRLYMYNINQYAK
jgi:hypothetical protein